MVVDPVVFRSQSGIAAVNEFLAAELLEDLLFQWFEGGLLILVTRKQGKAKNTAPTQSFRWGCL